MNAQDMSEKELRENIRDAARKLGWRMYFSWTSLHSPAGFPDLVLVRDDQLIFAELKREGKYTTVQQDGWLDALRRVNGSVQVFVWRPSDWLEDRILEVLR